MIFFPAGTPSSAFHTEIYDQGTITALSSSCKAGERIGGCKLDEDRVVLVGGKQNGAQFFIQTISTDSCEEKERKYLGWFNAHIFNKQGHTY